jgi:uncharacterized protein (DUF4415 family)
MRRSFAVVNKRPPPPADFHENPDWTEEDFARARAAREILSPAAAAALVRKPGRPRSAAPKVEVKIRLDAKTVEHLRESGPGWQTRVNAALGELVEKGRL